MSELDPVALLSEVIGLRSVLGDSIARERAMAATLTDCQRRCTAYETEHRAAHDALDEVTSAPRALPLDERVRVALVDVLAAAVETTERPARFVWGWSSSKDEERWNGGDETREEAIAEGLAGREPGAAVWIVQGRTAQIGDYLPRLGDVMEHVECRAADDFEEPEGIFVVADSDRVEAKAALDSALAQWAAQYVTSRGAWTVAGEPELVQAAVVEAVGEEERT